MQGPTAVCPPSCSSHQTTSRGTVHTSDLPLRGAFLKLRVYRHLFQRISLYATDLLSKQSPVLARAAEETIYILSHQSGR